MLDSTPALDEEGPPGPMPENIPGTSCASSTPTCTSTTPAATACFPHVVPVLLGDGARLFDNLGGARIGLEQVRAVEAPGVRHLKYRVTT